MLDLFATKAIEGLHRLFELLSIVTHFLEGCEEKDLRLTTIVTRILVMPHLLLWTVMTIVSICGNEARLTSWAVKVIGIWDHMVRVIGSSTAMWLTCL
jgi:hypothetical protein